MAPLGRFSDGDRIHIYRISLKGCSRFRGNDVVARVGIGGSLATATSYREAGLHLQTDFFNPINSIKEGKTKKNYIIE